MTNFAKAPIAPHKGKLLLTNARIFDAESSYDQVGDLLIENGKIADFGKLGKVQADETIHCGGKLLTAGLVDIQVHDEVLVPITVQVVSAK